MDCYYTKNVFEAVFEHFDSRSLHNASVGLFVHMYLDHWFRVHPIEYNKLYLPLFIFWAIWKQQNRCIFEGSTPSVYWVLLQAEMLSHDFSMPVKKFKHRIIGLPPKIHFPCGFFDGAVAKNKGGAGFTLLLSSSHSIQFSLGCGRCTNTKSELMTLWALLTVSKFMGIPLLSIYGDSLVIIQWATGKSNLNLPYLSHWCDEIKELLQTFLGMVLKHTYREHNQIVDSLSKKALLLDSGYGEFKEVLNDIFIEYGNFQLF